MKNWILSNKKIALAGIFVLAVILIAGGIFFYGKSSAPKAQTGNEQDLTNQPREINALGEVKCTRIENISIDFSALVTDILVKEGDRVTLGQPLMTLDITRHNAEIEKLKQQILVNQADILQKQSEIARKNLEYDDAENADLKLLKNALSLAETELKNAKRDLQNYQALYDAGAISKTELDAYEDALNQRQKAADDIQTNIQKTVLGLKDELDRLNVALKSSQAQLFLLQTDLNIMTGKINNSYINGGQIVSGLKNGIIQSIMVSNADHLGVQGMPTGVLKIMDADFIKISAEVDEEFVSQIRVGDSVRIVPAFASDTTLDGVVEQISDLAVKKDGKRVVYVLIRPNDEDNLLKPGYSAEVYFKSE